MEIIINVIGWVVLIAVTVIVVIASIFVTFTAVHRFVRCMRAAMFYKPVLVRSFDNVFFRFMAKIEFGMRHLLKEFPDRQKSAINGEIMWDVKWLR